jgi:hypothetical protein
MEMEEEREWISEDDEDEGVCTLMQRERADRYGRVPGLEDSELADPEELERQVVLQEWGPVLSLPIQGKRGWVRGTMDESGQLDFGAFGTVDFERHAPSFDKARYKADKLGEQLKDVLIMFSIVSDRINTRAKYLVLKYLKMGMIGLEQIASEDMRALARLYLRARRMQQEIAELREASQRRRQRRAEALLQSW